MEFAVGDKVVFLNAVGGGIIVSVKDKYTYMVQDEHGFHVPCRKNELVLISQPKEQAAKQSIADVSHNQKEIALHFIPEHKQDVSLGDFKMVISNHTGHSILFTLYAVSKTETIAEGKLENSSFISVMTVKRHELEKYCKLKFQALFVPNKLAHNLLPIDCEITIKPSLLYKNGAFVYSSAINNLAYSRLLTNPSAATPINQNDFDFLKGEKEQAKKISLKHNYARKDEEVDLHIHEILENPAGIDPAGILKIQLQHFKKSLDEAISQNHNSITFIHGIGKGTLKHELLSLLESYEGIKFYPASFNRYGNGAIKVEII